jgi:hypothetical protein
MPAGPHRLMATSSHDAALRDIQDLIDQGLLKKDSRPSAEVSGRPGTAA